MGAAGQIRTEVDTIHKKIEYRYQILSIPFSLVRDADFDLTMSEAQESDYLIEHDDSLFDDQLKRIAGDGFRPIEGTNIIRIPYVILVTAKKSPKQEENTRRLIRDGFTYNGVAFKRFGKSASQAKAGVTLFVSENVHEQIMEASTLNLPPESCVISKYEAQRCLILSVCTLIHAPLPHIVIIDEYTKVLPDQYIRYVTQEKRTLIDKDTGKEKTYNARVVKEGNHDIKLSPFDGCGCHDARLSALWSEEIGLDYRAVGFQIRLPFFKGYTVEVPFKDWFHEHGVEEITDIFGERHKVDDIDCLWNISMWKGYGMFKAAFGNDGWNEYIRRLNHYEFKLGISKYAHHKKDLPLKSRLNYQYLQCLDLWNDKYVDWFTQENRPKYDIMDKQNWGNLLKLANYTTDLYEKIISGNKAYMLKFLGIEDTTNYSPNSLYMEAALLNDMMLKDVCIRRNLISKLDAYIRKAKYGKIYADGFYHTVVGDMIGYLEYAAGMEPRGCLEYGQFYANTIPYGKVLSFRSPLVCPSEVNDVEIVTNEMTKKWFDHFKDQDVVMLNMYDLSMPRQGGMDADGDAVFLCHDPLLVNTKIQKPIIIDVEDKVTAKSKPYNMDSIVEYELATRDSRIGEITTVATSILNQYSNKEGIRRMNDDNVSLLRIFQGKEIDYIKTGVRWQMNKKLRRSAARIPYFLLYNYPKKLKTYEQMRKLNRHEPKENRLPLNAYKSPSPMNELCDYVDTWHKKRILWDRSWIDTRCLTVDYSVPLNDKRIRARIDQVLGHTIDQIANVLRENGGISGKQIKDREMIYEKLDSIHANAEIELLKIVPERNLIANYTIDVAYSNYMQDQMVVWKLFGDVILSNIKKHTPKERNTMIIEYPYATDDTFEFLGKHYTMIEGGHSEMSYSIDGKDIPTVIQDFQESSDSKERYEIVDSFCNRLWNTNPKRRTIQKEIRFDVLDDFDPNIADVFRKYERVKYTDGLWHCNSGDSYALLKQSINNTYTKYCDKKVLCVTEEAANKIRFIRQMYYDIRNGRLCVPYNYMDEKIKAGIEDMSQTFRKIEARKVDMAWIDYKGFVEESVEFAFQHYIPPFERERPIVDKKLKTTYPYISSSHYAVKYIGSTIRKRMLHTQQIAIGKTKRRAHYIPCPTCGNGFVDENSHSRKCPLCMKGAKQPPLKAFCETCGVLFDIPPRGGQSRYCPKCYPEHRRESVRIAVQKHRKRFMSDEMTSNHSKADELCAETTENRSKSSENGM